MTVRKWLDAFDNWATPADWTGGVAPGPSDDVEILQGGPTVTAAIAVHSIADNSVLTFTNTGGSSVAEGFAVGGSLNFDSTAGAGGSTLSVSGTFTISATGQAFFGNATSGGFTTFSANAISLRGALTLNAAAAEATYLTIHAAAGFGVTGVATGQVSLSGASVIRFTGGSIERIAHGASLSINGANAFVADTGATTANSALTSLSAIGFGAALNLSRGASVSSTQALYNYGSLDVDNNSGDGGSSFYTSSTLNNSGALTIGNSSLASTALVQAAGFKNRGALTLTGNGASKAILNITTGAANLGALTGAITLNSSSLIKVASGEYTSIAAGASLALNSASAFVADATTISSNSALTGLLSNHGSLSLGGGAAVTIASAFVNDGDIDDSVGTLTLQSTLTNAGSLELDNTSGASAVYTTGINNSGDIGVGYPIGAVSGPATLRVFGAAGFGVAGTVTGAVRVYDGGSIIFNSGAIYDIRTNGYLQLDEGVIQISGSPSGESALASLRQVEGELTIEEGSFVNTSVAFNNSGDVFVALGGLFTTASVYTNSGATTVGAGFEEFEPSTLTAAALRNSGSLTLDGDVNDFNKSSVIVHSAAGTGTVGALTGTVALSNDALLQFDSGAITTIEGSLSISTADAFVALKGAVNSNSALTSLRTISGDLELDDGAALSVSGNLAVGGAGSIKIDAKSASGGSSLSVHALLDNEGTVDIGDDDLSASVSVTTSKLTNGGALTLEGAGAAQALLSVNAAAGFGSGATVTGDVTVEGNAAIVFASGALTRIQKDASLTIDGRNAFVATTASPSNNTALNGLRVVDGTLDLRDGAVATPSAGFAVSAHATFNLDDIGAGGSIVSTGAVDNEGAIVLGNAAMTSANDLAVTRLTNNGALLMHGGAAGSAELYVGSAAGFGLAGEVTGEVDVSGNSLILFASGGLNRIDSGATLSLSGASAHVANTSNSGSDSALNLLAAVDGTFELSAGAVLTDTAAALTNNGVIDIDQGPSPGGSTLTVTRLNNFNELNLGATSISQTTVLSATSLDNEGVMRLNGHGAALAKLNVSGGTTNDGEIYVTSDTQAFAGIVAGAGQMYLYSGTTLEFDAAVAGTQTVLYGGADKLMLGAASSFAATIQGFAVSDTIDLKGYSAASTIGFSGDATSGVLTVTSGASVSHLHMTGAYTLGSFGHGSDGAGGLLISHT